MRGSRTVPRLHLRVRRFGFRIITAALCPRRALQVSPNYFILPESVSSEIEFITFRDTKPHKHDTFFPPT